MKSQKMRKQQKSNFLPCAPTLCACGTCGSCTCVRVKTQDSIGSEILKIGFRLQGNECSFPCNVGAGNNGNRQKRGVNCSALQCLFNRHAAFVSVSVSVLGPKSHKQIRRGSGPKAIRHIATVSRVGKKLANPIIANAVCCRN